MSLTFKMNPPRISVAMATYNGEKYIRQQLDSILNQTLPPCEIVVVDDCSTDNTYEILQEYAIKNTCIHVFQNEKNSLPAYTFRKAFKLTTGDYIAPCDQDDIWFEDKLEVCYSYMSETTKMIFHQDCIWYENGMKKNTNYPTWTLNEIIYSPRATGHTAFFSRDALEVFECTSFITYDWALILWGLVTKSYKQIDYVGCLWRRHEAALTNTVSSTNTWHPLDRGKWGGWKCAVNQLVTNNRCECISKDMADIEIILSKYLKSNKDMRVYLDMTKCFQKQTIFSMLYAAILNVKCQMRTEEYKLLSLKNKLARISHAFRHPLIWWLNLSEYLRSIGVS